MTTGLACSGNFALTTTTLGSGYFLNGRMRMSLFLCRLQRRILLMRKMILNCQPFNRTLSEDESSSQGMRNQIPTSLFQSTGGMLTKKSTLAVTYFRVKASIFLNSTIATPSGDLKRSTIGFITRSKLRNFSCVFC